MFAVCGQVDSVERRTLDSAILPKAHPYALKATSHRSNAGAQRGEPMRYGKLQSPLTMVVLNLEQSSTFNAVLAGRDEPPQPNTPGVVWGHEGWGGSNPARNDS